MSGPDDWRSTTQERYLTGVRLIHRQWRQRHPDWDHDHCEFCFAKFGAERLGDVLREEWTTSDEYQWICDVCFRDFHEQFRWRVEEDAR